jgi:FMN-dependent NADH-azoreductase
MQLLHIDSSILGPASVSRSLSAKAVAEWKSRHPGTTVTYRDLAVDPINHLSGALLVAQGIDASQHAPEIRRDLAVGAKVLEEFLAADVVVVGAPMYNFGIPTQLKAWIDRLAVAGKTFSYTAEGPKGLAGGKTVIIASSRGNFYGTGTPFAAFDHQETYLAANFGFFGITDIRFLRAEGVKVSPENMQKAIEAAERDVIQLIAA